MVMQELRHQLIKEEETKDWLILQIIEMLQLEIDHVLVIQLYNLRNHWANFRMQQQIWIHMAVLPLSKITILQQLQLMRANTVEVDFSKLDLASDHKLLVKADSNSHLLKTEGLLTYKIAKTFSKLFGKELCQKTLIT